MAGPWRLAVHSLMLHGLSAADGLALVRAHGYRGVFLQLDPDDVESTRPRDEALDITGVGFGPDDHNVVDPERAVAAAAALGAGYVRICGAQMTGQTYAAAYDATVRLW